MTRRVTEADFRMPEYRDAQVEDYEFRADGKLVRKDRWERGIQSIRNLVGIDAREFEIPDVVDAVRKLVGERQQWVPVAEEYPDNGAITNIRCADGSIINGAVFEKDNLGWYWNGYRFDNTVVTDWS